MCYVDTDIMSIRYAILQVKTKNRRVFQLKKKNLCGQHIMHRHFFQICLLCSTISWHGGQNRLGFVILKIMKSKIFNKYYHSNNNFPAILFFEICLIYEIYLKKKEKYQYGFVVLPKVDQFKIFTSEPYI